MSIRRLKNKGCLRTRTGTVGLRLSRSIGPLRDPSRFEQRLAHRQDFDVTSNVDHDVPNPRSVCFSGTTNRASNQTSCARCRACNWRRTCLLMEDRDIQPSSGHDAAHRRPHSTAVDEPLSGQGPAMEPIEGPGPSSTPSEVVLDTGNGTEQAVEYNGAGEEQGTEDALFADPQANNEGPVDPQQSRFCACTVPGCKRVGRRPGIWCWDR